MSTRPAIRFFSPSEVNGPDLVRSMKDWPTQWDGLLSLLMPSMTNHQIGKRLGATVGLVGFRIQKLGLTRSADVQETLYGGIRGRLVAGMNKANQQHPGTCKWVHKHKKRGGTKPEWWIFLGNAERMPLRRHLWLTWVGPIPKGHNVCFADGNTRRCLLSNLICIPNCDMAKRNRNAIKAAMNARAFWLTPAAKESSKKRVASMLTFWQSEEGQQVIARRSEKIRELNAEGLINNPFRNLHDKAVAYYLSQDKQIQEMILTEHPDLIELKRAELLLRRTLKQLSDDGPAA